MFGIILLGESCSGKSTIGKTVKSITTITNKGTNTTNYDNVSLAKKEICFLFELLFVFPGYNCSRGFFCDFDYLHNLFEKNCFNADKNFV